MTQQISAQYTAFTQTAEQKFIQAANFFMLKIMYSLVSAKQKLKKKFSSTSSRNSYSAESIHIQDLKDQVSVNYGNVTCMW